ncbi:MAG: HD domain-containing protein [Bacteroidales bacterium]|jgi:class 3 adenylate cyclase/ligand-binding sensor domain-containing protein/predicted metal-dependent HD superfamily phosphohydrolase|nr:HD domain-containing protein [Bacteroidales bacterium]
MNSISQSKEGFMLFGNQHGIITYNARYWKNHNWRGQAHFFKNSEGRVFVGGFNSLAEIQFPNNKFSLNYIVDTAAFFGQITHIAEHQKRLYFTTAAHELYYVENNTAHKILAKDEEITLFEINNTLYVCTSNELIEYQGKRIIHTFIGDFFAKKHVTAMFAFNNAYIVRANDAFYRVDTNTKKIEVFATEIDLQLQMFEYSCAHALSNNTLCVGSYQNGLYIIDKNGKLLQNLTMRTGNLNSNSVLDLFVDNENNLWVGQSRGVSRIETPSAFSYFHKNNGIRGGVNSVVRYRDALYIATEFGVLRLSEALLRPVFPTFKSCNVLYSVNDQLLVGSEDGLFSLSDYTNPKKISDGDIIAITYAPKLQLFFTASQNTIYIYRYENSRLQFLKSTDILAAEINSLAADTIGNIWIGSNADGVYRLQNADNFQNVDHFIDSHGLQKNYPWIQVYETSLGVLFSCSDGLYRFNNSTQRFYKDTLIPIPAQSDNYHIAPIVEDSEKNLWFSLKSSWSLRSQLAIARFVNNSYELNSNSFNKIDAFWTNTIFPNENSILWFGSSEGLLRMDLKQLHIEPNTKRPVFFRIALNNDSLVSPSYLDPENHLRIDHQYNSIRFDFVAPIFENHERVTYTYFLDGVSETWSEPDSETSQAFLNLPAGDYTFRVKSIDVYGNESPENTFSFHIKSPHLLQWWTFLIYAVLLLPVYFLLSLLFKWLKKFFTKGLIQQNEELQENYSKATQIIENILPKQTIEELTEKGSVAPRYFKKVTILFCDIADFTQISEQSSDDNSLIEKLNSFFTAFDTIIEKYRIEKIKTIGDAYMCAGGIPQENDTNPIETVLAALEMQETVKTLQIGEKEPWRIRIGIHTGPVIAGIIGSKKYFYDIWGDSVNTASRMETSGQIGEVNISHDTYELVKNYFECHYRGRITAKNKGLLKMYFVKGITTHLTNDPALVQPNAAFVAELEDLRYQDLEKNIFSIYTNYRKDDPNQYIFADIQITNKHFVDYPYHNLAHVQDVVHDVQIIGRNEGVSNEELLVLKLAALFHDIGLTQSYKNHEAHSINIARTILANAHYTQAQIDQVCELINATRMPQSPKNLLEQIMCDADLDYLGHENYFPRSLDLYNEFVARGEVERNEQEWLKLQIKFLQKHSFFTKSEQQHREHIKQKHIEKLQILLKNYTQ